MGVLECSVLILAMVLCAHCVQGDSQVHLLSSSKEVSLSCTSTSPWFFCVWEGPDGDRACALRDRMDTQGDSLCGEQERLEIRGNSSMCTLVIHSPRLSDHGKWTCAVSDDSSLETVKDYRQLDMVVEGEMVLRPDTSMVEMVEGEEVELVCMVENAYPAPEISWSVSREMVGVLDTSSHVVISPSSMSDMVTIQHHVYYTPSHKDHGMNISCMGTQGNMTRQVRSSMVRVRTQEVREMLVTERFGLPAVISISVFLLILCIAVFIIICVKNKKKSKIVKADLSDIKDPELQQSFVQEPSADKDALNDGFVDLYSNDCNNKSISSAASTKSFDKSRDNSSVSDTLCRNSDSSPDIQTVNR